MNFDDTLYGRVKNGVLTLSGNNASIRVDGGALVVSDGPTLVASDFRGLAPSLEQRMITARFRRAGCPINRIVVTRPDGFITFAAIKWLHGVGAGLVQLDWDGTVLLATGPAGNDRPSLRRAQALAAGNEAGRAITREILRAKLKGQAAGALLMGGKEVGSLIDRVARELAKATGFAEFLAIEASAAAAYWSLWASLSLNFARRHEVPSHWQTFGVRNSPLTRRPHRAVTPCNAVLNYLYGVLASEMTIALNGAGLDPGLGIFHTDTDRRASLTYDAMEVVRPYVDGWLAAWLADARFSKRDFYEEADGTVRITRPLTSHLAMTAVIWRPVTQTVAGWLARALVDGAGSSPVISALVGPPKAWQSPPPLVARMCYECGKALTPRQRKFCSQECGIVFNAAMIGMLPPARETFEAVR
jgi:CRISPR-associated endonuclease Cas1